MTRPRYTSVMAITGTSILLLQLVHARHPTQDEPIKLRADLVVLDAQVLHRKTALAVGNLVREDFILFEDGVKQQISHFSRDKLPLSVIILMDVSGSVWPDLKSFERLRQGAFEAVKLLKPEDEAALMQFAEKATLLQPFTRDRDLVVSALGRLDGRGQQGTYVDEGILSAADYLRSASNPDSRRAIIAVTDDVKTEFQNRVRRAPVNRSPGNALRELYESGSVVCALVYESADKSIDDPFPADTPVSVSTGRLTRGIARQFSESTGGISIRTKREDLPGKLAEMIERLRQRYTIAYLSSNTGRDGKFRKIKLSVTPEVEKREGGVALVTRKGYYAK